MTALALLYQKTVSMRAPAVGILFPRLAIREYLQSPLLTKFLFAALLTAVGLYVASLYYFFALGVRIDKSAYIIKQLTEENMLLEVKQQRKEALFADEHKDILQSMEKISSIIYLRPENVAVSRMQGADYLK